MGSGWRRGAYEGLSEPSLAIELAAMCLQAGLLIEGPIAEQPLYGFLQTKLTQLRSLPAQSSQAIRQTVPATKPKLGSFLEREGLKMRDGRVSQAMITLRVQHSISLPQIPSHVGV